MVGYYVKLCVVQCACIGISSLEIKTEADINDINECPYDHKSSTGVYAVCVFFVCIFCKPCVLPPNVCMMTSQIMVHVLFVFCPYIPCAVTAEQREGHWLSAAYPFVCFGAD